MATDDPLWRALRAAHERWAPGSAERFPPQSTWEPLVLSVGTENRLLNQYAMGAVPTVPAVPTEKEDRLQRTGEELAAEVRVAWLERAAIVEFEGGLSRTEAERAASAELFGGPPVSSDRN